jgi:hypothetical protein
VFFSIIFLEVKMNKLNCAMYVLILVMIAGCSTGGVDLVVNNLDWDPATKVAQVEIANIGSDDAGAFLVYVNADEFPESQNRRPQVSHRIAGLQSSDTLILQADFAPLAHPDNNNLGNVYQITALADPKSMIGESNEENNFQRTPVVIPTVELYTNDDQLVPANPAPINDGTSRLPVLFVHGHNLAEPMDQDFNYRKNWQDPLDYPLLLPKLPSFKIAIDRPGNAGHNIEAYYIRFQDQNRSITRDAAEIGEAINRILLRHGDPNAQQVKVVIIAYSKGTISSRWYLKHMMPINRPVSEFIAISPPNHGVVAGNSNANASLALRQLNNGYDENCNSFQEAHSFNFIERLNGHPIQDTMTDSQQAPQYRGEAPVSRSATVNAGDGILYVTLYATDNKDRVGGSTPSTDCQGRVLAKNLAPDAENLEVPQITALSPLLQTPLIVHANTVHTPDVICLALYIAVHHQLPPSNFSCSMESVDNREVPIVP